MTQFTVSVRAVPALSPFPLGIFRGESGRERFLHFHELNQDSGGKGSSVKEELFIWWQIILSLKHAYS